MNELFIDISILLYIIVSYVFCIWCTYKQAQVSNTTFNKQITPALLLAPAFFPLWLGWFILVRLK